jgi:hypothetical protein
LNCRARAMSPSSSYARPIMLYGSMAIGLRRRTSEHIRTSFGCCGAGRGRRERGELILAEQNDCGRGQAVERRGGRQKGGWDWLSKMSRYYQDNVFPHPKPPRSQSGYFHTPNLLEQTVPKIRPCTYSLSRYLVTRTRQVRYEGNGPHLLVVPARVCERGLAHEVRLVIVQICLLPPLETIIRSQMSSMPRYRTKTPCLQNNHQ